MDIIMSKDETMADSYSEENVYNAVKDENVSMLDEFIKQGLDINHVFTATKDRSAHGKTLLQFALSCYISVDSPILRYLLDAKCDVNKAVKIMCRQDNTSRIKLIRHRDRLQHTCLYTALCRRDSDLTRLLVRAGADVNLYDAQLCSSLWHAVDMQDERLVDIILSTKSVTIDTPDKHHISPLHVAALHANVDLVRKLINRGAILDVQNIKKMTPLVIACHKKQSMQTVHILLQHGADPNIISVDGTTSLSGALTKQPCEEDLVFLLIAAGVDVIETVTHMTKSVLFTRTLVNSPAILNLLIQKMEVPRSLKILASLTIKQILRKRTNGRSMYHLCDRLPLPNLLIQYLQLEKMV